MSQIGSTLSALRRREGLSQQELAARLGLTRSAIGMYETGKREPDLHTLTLLARFFQVDMNTLTGEPAGVPLPANLFPVPRFVPRPRLGTIACGKPILAVEEAELFDPVPEGFDCDFTLKCKGDSMINARIFDGDIVYIRAQPEVENGEIAAVRIGEEATLKRVLRCPDKLILEAANPLYDPLVYRGDEMNQVEILGKAIAFTSVIR